MSSSEETSLYQKGKDRDLDRRFEQLQKKQLWQGFSFIDALSTEEINILVKLWKKMKYKYRHLTFQDVSKLVELATRIEECRRWQKRETTRRRVARWRSKKVMTEISKVTTRKVQPSRKCKNITSVRQGSRRRVKSGATEKSKMKRCVAQRKGK